MVKIETSMKFVVKSVLLKILRVLIIEFTATLKYEGKQTAKQTIDG